jgi:FAD/FMN-containing dehydrogenase
VLIVELDGPAAEVEAQFAEVERALREHGAFEIRVAADDAERALIWKGRKSAFAAVGRISPDYIVQDGVIPRTALPEVLRRIAELSRPEHGVRVANVFHAGDGNLHPLVLFDDAVPGEAERAEEVSGAILDLCIEHGGSITGEHGVGVDKAKLHAEDVHRRRPRHDAAGALRVRPGRAVPTPARSSRRRGCAARCPAGTGPASAAGARARRSSDGPEPLTGAPEPLPATAAAAPARLGRAPRTPTEEAPRAAGRRRDLAVVVRGGGTKLDWGVPPRRST